MGRREKQIQWDACEGSAEAVTGDARLTEGAARCRVLHGATLRPGCLWIAHVGPTRECEGSGPNSPSLFVAIRGCSGVWTNGWVGQPSGVDVRGREEGGERRVLVDPLERAISSQHSPCSVQPSDIQPERDRGVLWVSPVGTNHTERNHRREDVLVAEAFQERTVPHCPFVLVETILMSPKLTVHRIPTLRSKSARERRTWVS